MLQPSNNEIERRAPPQEAEPHPIWRLASWALGGLGLALLAAFFALGWHRFDWQILFAVAALVAPSLLIALWATSRSRSRPKGRRTEDNLERIKDAHWQLADQAAHYRQLLDAQSDFVVRRAGDGHIVFANRAFCDAFEVKRDVIVGSMFHPPIIATEAPAKQQEAARRIVQLLRTRFGKRWVSWDEREVISDLGEREMLCVGRDITQDRETAEALRIARDQAEAASRAKSRFLAAMSHEIRTPMNGILGMTALLRQTDLAADQQKYAGAVEESARALLALIDDILDFSKIEAGKLELHAEGFSLHSAIVAAMQVLAPAAAAKRLAFTYDIDNDVPDVVVGDKKLLRQILLNLLSNAVKYTRSGSVSIHVANAGAERDPDASLRIAIQVADTGIGLTTEVKERLFDEFERGNVAVNQRLAGTGLGLAISRRLAIAMGGDITAEGAPGEGSTFTVVVRLQQAVADGHGDVPRSIRHIASPVGRAETGQASMPSFNVLVAEDNPVNAILTTTIVERAGGTVILAEDGPASVNAARQALENGKTLDVILMDIQMPGMDGLAATALIRSLYAELAPGIAVPAIIALTANAFSEDRERCLSGGMDDYLSKPFEPRQLLDLLQRWVVKAATSAPAAE